MIANATTTLQLGMNKKTWHYLHFCCKLHAIFQYKMTCLVLRRALHVKISSFWLLITLKWNKKAWKFLDVLHKIQEMLSRFNEWIFTLGLVIRILGATEPNSKVCFKSKPVWLSSIPVTHKKICWSFGNYEFIGTVRM